MAVADDPWYSFDTIDDCARFQSWLRHKQSLETFEVETVAACNKQKLADDVCLKIWQDELDGPSISLFANNWTVEKKADMHLEFPIGWFKDERSLGQAGKFTKLHFEYESSGRKSSNILSKIRSRKSKGLMFSVIFLLMLMLYRYDRKRTYN